MSRYVTSMPSSSSSFARAIASSPERYSVLFVASPDASLKYLLLTNASSEVSVGSAERLSFGT